MLTNGEGHPKSSRVQMPGPTMGRQERSGLLGTLPGWAELFLLGSGPSATLADALPAADDFHV